MFNSESWTILWTIFGTFFFRPFTDYRGGRGGERERERERERQTISTQGGVGCSLPVLKEGWETGCYYSRSGGRPLLCRKGWRGLYQKMLLIVGFFTGSDKLFFFTNGFCLQTFFMLNCLYLRL